MAKLQVLCGFENADFEEALVKELKRAGQDPVIHVRYSKESVKEFLEKNTECSTVVLTEKMGKEKYTAEELAQLTDKRDINVVAVISPRLQGTEYVKTLYTANITGAIFQTGRKGVGPKDVVEQIVNRRSRKDARVYYGIEGQKLDMNVLDEDTYVEYYKRLVNGDFILKSYIDLCVKMTPQQIADFTKRLPKEALNELGKYEEFYLIVDLLREFKIDLKIKRPKKVMLGFKVKPQLGMSEGGLTFEPVKEPEEVAEEVVENAVEEEDKTVAEMPGSFSADVHVSGGEMVDDIFALLDGGSAVSKADVKEENVAEDVAEADERKPIPRPIPQKPVEPVVAEDTENRTPAVKPVEKPVTESETEIALRERLHEQELMLEERQRQLEEERQKVADEAARFGQYRAAMADKEQQYEDEIRRARIESVKSENEMVLKHEKEVRVLQKEREKLEKEMARRGILEDEEEEDVYLAIKGPQFSVGVILLVLWLVAAIVVALIFLRPF